MRTALAAIALVSAAACSREQHGSSQRWGGFPDSARYAFARRVDSLLLDTHRHEIRGHISVVIPNPNKDDESPLAFRDLVHPSTPPPHITDGEMHAEVEALRNLLGRELPVEIDTTNHQVFVGTSPEVAMMAHPHGNAWYVPVKLFARQYGAYVDVTCSLANGANIWTKSVIEFAKSTGIIGTGLLHGHAEGLVSGINPRRRPSG